MTVLAHPLNNLRFNLRFLRNLINALNMFSGRASLGPTGRSTYSTRETPALSDREPVLKKVGQKEGMRKNKWEQKSIVVPKVWMNYQSSCRRLILMHVPTGTSFTSRSTALAWRDNLYIIRYWNSQWVPIKLLPMTLGQQNNGQVGAKLVIDCLSMFAN